MMTLTNSLVLNSWRCKLNVNLNNLYQELFSSIHLKNSWYFVKPKQQFFAGISMWQTIGSYVNDTNGKVMNLTYLSTSLYWKAGCSPAGIKRFLLHSIRKGPSANDDATKNQVVWSMSDAIIWSISDYIDDLKSFLDWWFNKLDGEVIATCHFD